MGELGLDQEWVQLIKEAREVGIQKEEISPLFKGESVCEPINRYQ